MAIIGIVRLAAAWIVIFSEVLGFALSVVLLASLPQPTTKASIQILIKNNRIFLIQPPALYGINTYKCLKI